MTANLTFDQLRKRLEKALKFINHTHTVEDIQQGIAMGQMQCFVRGDSFVITEIAQTPRKRFLNIVLLVGDMGILEAHDELIEFAKRSGCDFMRAAGRKGWRGIPEKLGWKPTHIMYVRELRN